VAPHSANWGCQQAAGIIGMRFAGLDNRLFADNALAVEYFQFVERIVDFPMPRGELNGIFALILDGYGVTKGEVHFVVFEERTFKTSLYGNFDAFRYLCCHVVVLV